MTPNPYESPTLVTQYLLFHYGTDGQQLGPEHGPREALHFPVRSVTECLDPARLPARERALDLGCSVGRASFELARYFARVTALDLSHAFVAAAQAIQQHGHLRIAIPTEGRHSHEVDLYLPGEIARDQVSFQTGDALNLPVTLGTFDAVLAANLLDRVPDPKKLLATFPTLLNPGGQLILTSPYTWLEEYTPRENWPAGTSFALLEENLLPHFTLHTRKNLPFLIREHARKFQWSIAEATVWIKS